MGKFNLDAAFAKALKNFINLKPEQIIVNSGVLWDAELKSFTFSSLSKPYFVSYPQGIATEANGTKTLPEFNLLTLHYLNSRANPLTGAWISFKDLPGGAMYQGPFYARTIRKLIAKFGSNLQDLDFISKKLGGEKFQAGNLAIKFSIFPYLPIAVVMWQGDEEFPPAGNVLLDENAKSFLTTEDYVVIAEHLVNQLVKI